MRRQLAALHVKVAKAQAVVRGKLQRARFLRVRAPECAARAGQHRSARQYMLGVLLPCSWPPKFLRPPADCLVTCS